LKTCKTWLLATMFAILLVPASAQAAGGVSGTVTAVGGGALEGISVCARDQLAFSQYCATTGAGGEYEIEIPLAGKYRVKFEGGDDYVDRWFADAPSEPEAEVLSISSHLTEGVDAELPPAGQVGGTVVDAASKAGIESVSVCATSEDSVIALGCATTDAAGHYLLGGLPPDTYTVSFNPGFGPTSQDYLNEFYDDSPGLGEAMSVEVTAGAASTAIDAELEKGALITGTVTDESDQPIEGATVCTEVAKPRPNFGPCATTGAGGSYTIHGLRSGEYRVRFFPNPFSGNLLPQYYDDQPSRKLAGTITATAPATVTGINATLHPGGQIKGTITEADGMTPIQTARACAVEVGSVVSEGGGRCAQSAADGSYTISALPTGTYEVILSGGFGNPGFASERWDDQPIDEPGTPVAVTAGATVTGIDGALPQSGTIRGTVTAASDDSPIQSIEVCAFRGHQEEGRCLFTSASGNYEFTGLDAGSYAVRFRPGTPFGPGAEPSDPDYVTQWYPGQTTRADAQPLDVTPGSVLEEVDAEMISGSRISGTITGPGAVPIPSGYACTVPGGGEEERCGFADKTGSYVVHGLAPDLYKVRFGANPVGGGAGWLAEFWDDAPTATAADEVEVLGGVTEEVDAELQPAGAISGRVTVAGSGAPLEGAFICAVPDGETEAANCAEARPNGNYLIPLLTSGAYRVEFSVSFSEEGEAIEEFATQFYKGAGNLGAGALVNVAAGSTTGSIDAAMAKPGSTPEPPEPEEGGGQPAGNPPVAIPPAITLPIVKPVVRKPHCGKTKKLKKVRGKWHCVKKKARPRHQKRALSRRPT
jgi:hypothetical protein